MPSLDSKFTKETYLITDGNDYPFRFELNERDDLIKSILAMKKNVVYIKQQASKEAIIIQNVECLQNNKDFTYIPHRLKKSFKSLDEYQR